MREQNNPTMDNYIDYLITFENMASLTTYLPLFYYNNSRHSLWAGHNTGMIQFLYGRHRNTYEDNQHGTGGIISNP